MLSWIHNCLGVKLESTMGGIPILFVGLFVLIGVILGLGLAWGGSWWGLLLLASFFLSSAYMMTRNVWTWNWDTEKNIRSCLSELQRLTNSQREKPSFEPRRESLDSEMEYTVDVVKNRIGYLEEERTKISSIVQNLVEGVVAFDSQGQVLFANDSACRILGSDDDQLKGQSVWEVVRNQELAALVERSRDLAIHERQFVEIVLHVPTRMTVEVYGLPFPLTNQKNGSVMVLHDVTQLRRLEQVRAEFIDNVSHELRTPLAAIIGYLETLIDEPSLETPHNRKFVQVAHQHAERLNRLVDDLRSLSEIESGTVALRWEVVELKKVIDEVLEMFQSHAQKKSLQFSNYIDVDVCVWADRDRVIQILLNLIDNAIKYSFEGGCILFHVKRLEKMIVLQVTDTGQGIPSTDLHRITERFYRVDRARSREEGGTGLGLSIVKHLVQLLGGHLRIQSEIGKGTRIEIDLPVRSQENLPSA